MPGVNHSVTLAVSVYERRVGRVAYGPGTRCGVEAVEDEGGALRALGASVSAGWGGVPSQTLSKTLRTSALPSSITSCTFDCSFSRRRPTSSTDDDALAERRTHASPFGRAYTSLSTGKWGPISRPGLRSSREIGFAVKAWAGRRPPLLLGRRPAFYDSEVYRCFLARLGAAPKGRILMGRRPAEVANPSWDSLLKSAGYRHRRSSLTVAGALRR